MTESNTKSCQCVDLSIQFNDIAPMEPKKNEYQHEAMITAYFQQQQQQQQENREKL